MLKALVPSLKFNAYLSLYAAQEQIARNAEQIVMLQQEIRALRKYLASNKREKPTQ